MSYPPAIVIATKHGKPYPPLQQGLGQKPTVVPDVPVCAVFLFLFVGAAVGHMGLFQFNLRRGRKFILSAALFGFCMTRILATILRIVWACRPNNVRVGIAAMIFVYAGIIIVFIANLFFAQRIVRALHPHVGWSRPFSLAIPVLLVVIIGSLICLIVGVIYSFYTLNRTSLRSIHDIQKYGQTLYAVMALLPIPTVLAAGLARRRPQAAVDHFGSGSMTAKLAIVIVSAVFLALGACWRTVTTYLPAPEFTNPSHPWYLSKPCFYVFDFTIEFCVTLFWLVVRVDRRFIVPNGAKGPYSYTAGGSLANESSPEKSDLDNEDPTRRSPSAFQTQVADKDYEP